MGKDWTDNIRERMKEHRTDAPDMLWNNIEKQLNEKQRKAEKRHLRITLIRKMSAAAVVTAVLLTTGISLYNIYIKRYDTSDSLITSRENTPKNTERLSARTESAAEDEPSETGKPSLTASLAGNRILAKNSCPEATDKDRETGAGIPTNTGKNTEDANIPNRKEETASAHQNTILPRSRSINTGDDFTIARAKGKKWQTNIYASYVPTNGNSGNNISTLGTTAPANIKLKHQPPLDFGIKIRRNLSERVFAETGIGYSYHKSTYQAESFSYKQYLHYLKVPVNIGCSVWKNKKLNIYVSAGGAGEKLIKGLGQSVYSTSHPLYMTEREHLKESRIQWSVDMNAGLEYKISEPLKIFIEPGAAHYFDNGSDINNIYKDKPNRFKLQIGLVFIP